MKYEELFKAVYRDADVKSLNISIHKIGVVLATAYDIIRNNEEEMRDVTNKMIFDGYKALSDKIDALLEECKDNEERLDCQSDIIEKQTEVIFENRDRIDELYECLEQDDEEAEDEEKDDGESAENIISYLMQLIDEGYICRDDALQSLIGAIYAIARSKRWDNASFNVFCYKLAQEYKDLL